MVYPAYFKFDTAYAAVLSDIDYIMVKRLNTSIEIKFGPNKTVVEEIVERYGPIAEKAFMREYQKHLNNLMLKNESMFSSSGN